VGEDCASHNGGARKTEGDEGSIVGVGDSVAEVVAVAVVVEEAEAEAEADRRKCEESDTRRDEGGD